MTESGPIRERGSSQPISERSAAALHQALALALAVGVRTAAYYELDNAVMQRAVTVLYSLLKRVGEEEGPVTLGVHSHCVFVGKSRVRTTVSTYPRFAHLIQLFSEWGIRTLTFDLEL
ncbi:MAG: hypothetical protein H5T84_01425, partial [Thermoleophilia bacterium]|nr:hypothetical protein [Thermoleophilia bacterium]